MNREELISQTKSIIQKANKDQDIVGVYAEACEFLRVYAGPRSSFLRTLERFDPFKEREPGFKNVFSPDPIRGVLESFLDYVESGLHEGMSPERRAQLDVVSDFLNIAHSLLDDRKVHPAAPAVLVGATLEEFLRNWIETEGLSLGNRKRGLEAYSQILRDAELITKQDSKDITAWAGLRNHAAHGEWDEVEDRNRVSIMLEGVNLFMRKYAK